MAEQAVSAAGEETKLELLPSRQFPEWLAEVNASITFTTYQAGKLFHVGLNDDGRLSIFNRTLDRCMGVAFDDDGFFVSTLYQLYRFENVLEEGQIADGFDRLYVPQVGYITGDIDIHDIGIDKTGRPLFVNSLFSCLATVSLSHSFIPVWQPKFVSKLAAEDRCHLNGLAMEDGAPKYVTAISRTDTAGGWREQRENGGIVIDVATNEIVADGLSMPHSPRLHDGKLWLHNSGTGHFGFVDIETGHFEAVAFCPGYLRGLDFIGPYAVAGISKSRDKNFSGLQLDQNLENASSASRCAILVIDTRSGDTVHYMQIEGVISELYDVSIMPGVTRPMSIGFRSDEIRRILSIDKVEALRLPGSADF